MASSTTWGSWCFNLRQIAGKNFLMFAGSRLISSHTDIILPQSSPWPDVAASGKEINLSKDRSGFNTLTRPFALDI